MKTFGWRIDKTVYTIIFWKFKGQAVGPRVGHIRWPHM